MTWDSLKSLILYASKIPLPNLIEKILYTIPERRHIARYVGDVLENRWDGAPKGTLHWGHIKSLDTSLNPDEQKTLDFLTTRYMDHRFDILGSGWVTNRYGTEALGMEGHVYHNHLPIEVPDSAGKWLEQVVTGAHLGDAVEAWQLIQSIHPGYIPIDWQRDIKSGFRWDAKLPFDQQMKLYRSKPGVDVKVAWDLGHFVHLPQMALAASIPEQQKAGDIIAEIKCQILDFIATNPVGMGVNYAYSLEAGFRSANWLIALDILHGAGHLKESEDFEGLVNRYLGRALHHMLENLEYREGLYSNHYLGDIVGLLFIARYYEFERKDQVLYFAISELLDCIGKQYFEDGGFFEGSTSYHRFATEMTYYGLAIIRGLSREKLGRLALINTSDWPYPVKIKKKDCIGPDLHNFIESAYGEKLCRAAKLSLDFTHGDSDFPQFGDNDSARFLALLPKGDFIGADQLRGYHNLQRYLDKYGAEESYWKQDHTTHGHIVAMAGSLFRETSFKEDTAYRLDRLILKNLAANQSYLLEYPVAKLPSCSRPDLKRFSYKRVHSINAPSPGKDLRSGMTTIIYPEMQMYALRSDRVYLAMSGLSNKRMLHRWTHVHNDALGVELYMDGQAILKDPGTYCYTALPERRKHFRNTAAHNLPMIDDLEQNRDLGGSLGLFNLRRDARVQLQYYSENEIILSLRFRKYHLVRQVEIQKDSIVFTDYANHPFLSNFHHRAEISDAYGYVRDWEAPIKVKKN